MNWIVTTDAIDVGGPKERYVVRLNYKEREVKRQCTSQGSLKAVEATLNAEAESYERQGWEPSYSSWVMSGARILNDSLTGDSGRQVDYVYLKTDDVASICCTGAAQFWFHNGLCFKFSSPETGVLEMNEEEKLQFAELVLGDLVFEAIRRSRQFDQAEYSAARSKAKKSKTKKELTMEEQEARLRWWKYHTNP